MLPALVLVVLVGVGMGAGYYFAAADNPIVVSWSQNPLIIKFSLGASTSGSASDSFVCSSPVAHVTLQVQSSAPSIITLTVSPSSFPSCGSTADNVVVTASCTASAIVSGTCGEGASGMVVVCGPTPYTCLKRALVVPVAVTNKSQ